MSLPSFKNPGKIPSIPAALCLFNLSKAASTSAGVIGKSVCGLEVTVKAPSPAMYIHWHGSGAWSLMGRVAVALRCAGLNRSWNAALHSCGVMALRACGFNGLPEGPWVLLRKGTYSVRFGQLIMISSHVL